MGKRGARGKGRGKRGSGADAAVLPRLDSLSDLPAYGELHASERQRAEFERILGAAEDASELVLGCVVRLDRGYPAIVCEDAIFRAEFAARLTKGKGENSRVAVGDWVCARRPERHDMGLIEEILPRESDIARWKGGARGEKQTLAANVDVVLVVQQLGAEPVSCERIARSAVIARDCGAQVAVVFTKADRATDGVLERDVEAVRDILGEGCSLAMTASAGGAKAEERARAGAGRPVVGWGADAGRAHGAPGRGALVLGESGAGKSTLLNAHLGREALETGEVREADDMGRHTTVARRMVSLPGAGIIVDEPGLRSLPIVGHERGLAMVFPDISDAARGCRFNDCTHTHEPGCEVRAQFDAGEFSAARLDCYLALAAEMRESAQTLDPDVVL